MKDRHDAPEIHLGRYFEKNGTFIDIKGPFILSLAEQHPDKYVYEVHDEKGNLVYRFRNKQDCSIIPFSEYMKSDVKRIFDKIIKVLIAKRKAKDEETFKKLFNSDTLVIHCADKSTDMLSQIYEGRGWDVIRDGNISKEHLAELIKAHDRIVCLGHGTGSGLINVQNYGYIVGDDEAPLLKDKKIFAIWCNATDYFKHHDIGHGQFITKNVPSEVWEARAVGFNVSANYILENITYWAKCCADVIDQAFSGDVAGAVKKAQEAYQAKYGNDTNPDQKGVTDYNTDAIQVQP